MFLDETSTIDSTSKEDSIMFESSDVRNSNPKNLYKLFQKERIF